MSARKLKYKPRKRGILLINARLPVCIPAFATERFRKLRQKVLIII
jgi:hypothetical protein